MTRARNILTALEIRSAKPGRMSDGGGLYLDRTATGGKWVWRYTIAGRKREMGLGSLDAVGLAEARRARDRWAAVLRDGRDPISERARLEDEELAALDRKDPTFAEVAADAFDARKSQLRGDGERGRWFSPIRVHIIPKIGKRRISKLTQRDIADALRPIWKDKPATAEKAIQRIGIILAYGRKSGYPCHEDLAEHAAHILGDLKHSPEGIVATPWEVVPALMKALARPAASYRALRWIILTAARSDSARGARFDEIEGDVWTVPAERMKAREGKAEPFRIPLSAAALDVLDECRDLREGDYLFPGYRAKPISQNALLNALNDMGEAGRPHGFRTSFRTWVQDTDAAPFDVAETALGHIIGGTVERSYARSDLLDRRRALMNRWGEFVTGQAAKVVPIRGQA